jgi:hypothetical protein
MTIRSRLTGTEKATIVRKRTAGVEYNEIAEGLSANEDQVRKAYDSYMLSLQLPPKVHKRHRVIKGHLALFILDIVKNDPYIEYTKVVDKLKRHEPKFEHVPDRTSIARCLLRAGWKSKEAPKRPLVSKVNRGKRLLFAKNYEDEDVSFSEHIIWSDEFTAEAFPQHHKLRVLVHCTQKYWEVPINPQVQQGGFKVTFGVASQNLVLVPLWLWKEL